MPRESKRSDTDAGAVDGEPVAEAPRAGHPAGGAAALAPGLYLVATPIGNARDVTLRALDVLAGADALAAEDTRRTRQLLQIHGIALGDRPLTSYHDRNGPQKRPQILAWLAEGRSVAYCSDAGTPLVADPGYRLVEAAIAAGHALTAVPGPSAVLAALSVSGLPTDRFHFAGFLPSKEGERRRALAALGALDATLVIFESPRRLGASLAAMTEILGDRPAAVARELTKRHEEAVRAPLSALAARYADEDPRGEMVVVIGPPGPGAARQAAEADLDGALIEALEEAASVRDAVAEVSAALGLPRKTVYARALAIARGGDGAGDG